MLLVIEARVSLPDANLVPLHPPLAVQLEATGDVVHVSTGTRLPVAEVLLAVNVIVPAVWAWANEPSNRSGRANEANMNLCISGTNPVEPKQTACGEGASVEIRQWF